MNKNNFLRCLLCFTCFVAGFSYIVCSTAQSARTLAELNSSFNYKTKYDNSTEMYTDRSNLAIELCQEGFTLLKNDNNVLPLKKSTNSKPKICMIGTSIFPYDEEGNERDGAVLHSWSSDPWSKGRFIWPGENVLLYGGCTGGGGTKAQTVTLEDGTHNIPYNLDDELEKCGISVNPGCKKAYSDKPYINAVSFFSTFDEPGDTFFPDEPWIDKSEIENADQYDDACIVTFYRTSSENGDYYPGHKNLGTPSDTTHEDGAYSALSLSNNEKHLIDVANEISDNVIVLLVSALPMEIKELKDGDYKDKVDAICWSGITSLYGMRGVTKVLAGEVSPSGSLPDTFEADTSSSPAAQNFGFYSQNLDEFTWSSATKSHYTSEFNDHYVVMAEGIYTGYSYYETRYADCVKQYGNASGNSGLSRFETNNTWNYENEVAYPFGYGLSYTTFDVSIVNQNKPYIFDSKNKSFSLSVEVKNTGTVAGKHTVQLYVSSPFTDYDKNNGIEKSAIQLIDFNKTDTLKPNESQVLTLNIPIKYIASYDEGIIHDGVTGGYILESTPYKFAIGNGSHDALNNILYKENHDADLYIDNNLIPNENLSFEIDLKQFDELAHFDQNGINSSYLAYSENDVLIQNQAQDADYNSFNSDETKQVKYLSRNDYLNTFPIAYAGENALDVTSSMSKYLGTSENDGGRVYEFSEGEVTTKWNTDYNVLDDSEGNIIGNLNIADLKGADYNDKRFQQIVTEIPFEDAKLFAPEGSGSCNGISNIELPLVYQADGPCGCVSSELGTRSFKSGYLSVTANDPNYHYLSTDMPCEPTVAATFNKELVKRQGEMYGEDSLWTRNPIMWAPGTNLHRCPFNSRNLEYYSEDPILSNYLTVQMVRGGLSKGLILSPKHFALNSQESRREGLSQFTTEQTLRERELRCFQGAYEDVNYVDNNGHTINALGAMTSFSRIGVTQVNGHRGVMHNILRLEWGFKGLSSTDFHSTGFMFNPQDSVWNNVTLMAANDGDSLLKTYWSDYDTKTINDPVLNECLAENMHYYLYAIANSNALNGIQSNSGNTNVMENNSPVQTILLSIGISLMGISSLGFVLIFIKSKRKKTNENK